MEDPTVVPVVALEAPSTKAVDVQQRALIRTHRIALVRLIASMFATSTAMAIALTFGSAWFITQTAILAGYTFVCGRRYERAERARDDYEIFLARLYEEQSK